MKYRVLLLVLSDKALIRYLGKRFDTLKREELLFTKPLPVKIITRRVNAVLGRLYPRTRCLVRSVVLNETLMLHGHTDQKIKFGIKYNEDKLLAHAWIGPGSDFKTIYEL
jgi:hypothetical protein